jgi:hypothetical protein
MKRHLAILTAVIALAGVTACDKDSDKDKPKPATSVSTVPSAGPSEPDLGASKPPLPTPGESLKGIDHRSESPAAS